MTQINTRELLLKSDHWYHFDPELINSPVNRPAAATASAGCHFKPCRPVCSNRYRGIEPVADVCNQPVIDTIQLLKQPYQPDDNCQKSSNNFIDTVSYLKYPHQVKSYTNTRCQQLGCQCQTSEENLNTSECQCLKKRPPAKSTTLLRAANLISENLYIR